MRIRAAFKQMSLSSAVKCVSAACLVLGRDVERILQGFAIFGSGWRGVHRSRCPKIAALAELENRCNVGVFAVAIVFNPILPLDMYRDEWWWVDLLGAMMFGGILGYENRSWILATSYRAPRGSGRRATCDGSRRAAAPAHCVNASTLS
jgi:hypothetical protein